MSREAYGCKAHLYVCPCNHVCFLPLPSEQVLAAHYSDDWGMGDGFNIDVSDEQWSSQGGYLHQNSFVAEIQRLAAKYAPTERVARIHDVGCGYGALVARLGGLGFDATGNDIDPEAIRKGRQRGNGRIHCLPVGELQRLSSNGFDLVVSYHAIEHYREPLTFFRQVRENLAPEGVLLFRVPNGDYYPARRDSFAKFKSCFFPGHLHYLTPQSATHLLERSGLVVLELASTVLSHDGQDDWFLQTLLGEGPSAPHHRGALTEALARNYKTWELQVVATRSDSAHIRRREHNIRELLQARGPLPDGGRALVERVQRAARKVYEFRTLFDGVDLISFDVVNLDSNRRRAYFVLSVDAPDIGVHRMFFHGGVAPEDAHLLTEDRRPHGFANWDFPLTEPGSMSRCGELVVVSREFEANPGAYRFTFGLMGDSGPLGDEASFAMVLERPADGESPPAQAPALGPH